MDPNTLVESKNCSECKKPIPESFKESHSLIGKQFCSTNCFNKENWKSERTQLILYCIFGLFILFITGSFVSPQSFTVSFIIIIGLVIYQINKMKDFPWHD
jgi:predicted nucleic acid-binding Zn ribbon protein